jgi:RimJ/RimL family protein N-acetyltransferase
MQTITASQLVLEPLTVAHARAMFEVLADPEIYRYLDYPPPPSVEHLHDVYERLEARKSSDGKQVWLNWVILPPGHPPVGYVQATIVSGARAWIAYALSSKHWGRGYAHIATDAMLAHLTAAYGVGQFLATVEAANLRSIRLLQRLCFRTATTLEAKEQRLTPTERLFVR